MNKKTFRIAGIVLTSLVGVVLILAGVLKLLNVGAEDMLEGLEKANLLQHTSLISVTAIICGTLLVLPQSWRFGFLLSTAYWGGAIVAHLTYDDWAGTLMPGFFLVLMVVGGWCRGVSQDAVEA